jgi:TolB-like protein/DNA-binding winged helix-turn-helix (wHTH) protein
VALTTQVRQVHARFAFGAFEIDLTTGEITKHGIRVRLQDQPFRILQALIERPGELVSREELQKQIWPSDTFVDFDHGINNAIKRLREALSDSAEDPRYIETVPRRGYRFIAQLNPTNGQPSVESLEENLQAQTPVSSRRWVPSSALMGLAALLVVGVIAFALHGVIHTNTGVAFNVFGFRDWVRGNHGAPRIQSLAVLPLTNLSGDPAQEYFADGFTDALIGELSQITALKVVSRTSVMRYKKTDKSLPEIARELGVDGVIEGTVQRSGDRVRITAQLIQGATDKHIWASSYQKRMEDVLLLQGDIASEIAEEIRVNVTPQEKLRMTHTRPINLEAVEAYLQGRYHYQIAMDMGAHRGAEKAREPELKLAINLFQRAISKDPSYAPAYIGMGEIWGVPATFPYPPRSMEEPAKEELRKALAIDSTLAQAHVDLGRIEFREWNWQAAEQEFKRAIELNPNLANARIYYTDYLNAMGRLDEAMEQAERAKALEPGNDQVAWQFYVRHQFDRFIEMKRSDVARHAFGGMAHFDLGHGYERAHMYKEAVEEWEEAMTSWGYADLAEELRRGYEADGFRGAVRGWTAGLEALHKTGEAVHPDLMAYLYGIIGEKDRAFAWLEESIEMHSSGPSFFKIDPDMDELRSDPRFDDLVRRLNFPRFEN